MTVREILETAREAALERRRIDEQSEIRRLSIGVQGHSMGFHSKSGLLDPTRKIDALIEWQEEQASGVDMGWAIDDGKELLRCIAKKADALSVEMARRYYIDAESWSEVAQAMEESIPIIKGKRRRDQVTLLSLSMDATIDEWEGFGTANIKELGR